MWLHNGFQLDSEANGIEGWRRNIFAPVAVVVGGIGDQVGFEIDSFSDHHVQTHVAALVLGKVDLRLLSFFV